MGDGAMEANESDGAHDDKVHVKAPECMEGDCEDVLFDAEEDSQSCSESGELAAPEGAEIGSVETDGLAGA
ncbi:unnamed protein product [Effrenium voratum]|uniref:Uncharacterized protein n=1 Tax=Effrenium voratum TaxID=2562239 RepID=A0AA36IBQ3_9DINO|nr:unnamed protein product [Effrenium voratum]